MRKDKESSFHFIFPKKKKKKKKKKAAGPDGVHNEMIKNFTPATVEYLLRIINTSWKTSKVPYQWKQGLIKPMFKAGKPRNELKSFRPITLTSVVGKLAERLVYDRLIRLAHKTFVAQTHYRLDSERGEIPASRSPF